MEGSHRIEMVDVLNKDGDILYTGVATNAIEWIIKNPVGPEMVKLEWTKNPMSIDDYLNEWDLLNDL